MNYIYWLSQIQHTEKLLLGNQLYILSQLLQHDYSVLPGFVLSNDILRLFLTNSDNFQSLMRELSDSSFLDNYVSLQSVAHRSLQVINQTKLEQKTEIEIFQAAQQLNSDYLILQPFFSTPTGQNIGNKGFWRSHTCNAHPQALTQTIKKIWSELFSAKSLIYRHKLGLGGQKINLSILVRPLKRAYASGIVEISPDLLRIRAIWGQEQSLVQGDGETDEYYLERQTGNILSRSLGHKNYCYRIKPRSTQVPLVDCLEAYLPDQPDTETFVLEQKAIAQLFSLTQQVLQNQPQLGYFLWTAPKAPSNESPSNFLITQCGEHLFTAIDLLDRKTNFSSLSSAVIEPLLTGISAAPGKAISPIVVIEDNDIAPESIKAGSILVVRSINSCHVLALANAKGIITETGGKTCHAAILARELNIPAVVNVVGATAILTDGMEIVLDGGTGKIYPANAAAELSLLDNAPIDAPPAPNQLIATKLMVNISQPQTIPLSINLPTDGVGLLRSELLLAKNLANISSADGYSSSFQSEFTQSLKKYLQQFSIAFAPNPVFYRSLDWSNCQTTNSPLSDRGTYNYLLDSTLFSLELNVLSDLAQEGYNNLNLTLPFVRSVEEFKYCYRLIEDVGLTARKSFQVWIMAEVPSVIWLLPEYIKAGVQGIAIGTNDLTQLLLGVDREQAQFSQQGLNASHTAVQKAIAQLIATARQHNIDCCICGQAVVEYPTLIDKLINWGITAISVEPQAVNQTYKAIASAERRILLNSLKSK